MSAAARKLAEDALARVEKFEPFNRVAKVVDPAEVLARELLAALDREAEALAMVGDYRAGCCLDESCGASKRAEAAEKAQLESEDELATELAEARTLLQSAEKALREIVLTLGGPRGAATHEFALQIALRAVGRLPA